MKTNKGLRDHLRCVNSQDADIADRLWQSEFVKVAHSRSNSPDSNENGYEHCLSVEANIWKFIIDSDREGDFSDIDMSLLSCSACCHDLDKGLRSALKGKPPHGKGSKQYVESSTDLDSILTMPWRQAIGDIIASHDLKYQDFLSYIAGLDKEYCIGHRTVDLQRFAIILKVGDTLHTDASRIPLAAIDPANLSTNERMKREARRHFTGWVISGIKASAKEQEAETVVRIAHAMMCRDHWASVEQHLDDMHFPHLLQLRIRSNGVDSVRVVEYWETQSRFILSFETSDQLLERYRSTDEILLKSQVAQEIVHRAEMLREDNNSKEAITLNSAIETLLKDETTPSLRNCRSEALYNLSTSFVDLYHDTQDNVNLQKAMKYIKESIALGNRFFNYACILALQNDTKSAFEELRGCLERREVKWEDVEIDKEWKILRDDPRYEELKRRWGFKH